MPLFALDLWSAALSRAHDVWPARWVPAALFIDRLRARLPAESAPAEALPRLAVEDLYLASACALGVASALETFVRTILPAVDAHVARFDGSATFKDEVRQTLATKLLVAAPGEAPAISEYAGRSPLSAWVRSAAIRTALNLRRGKAATAARAAACELDELVGGADVELEVIRRRYCAPFEAAIARALAALPLRDRTLLRLRFLEGTEVDRIAATYGVHRATATRWLADARARLVAATRRILTAELGATGAEIDSIAGQVRSQLQVSLAHL